MKLNEGERLDYVNDRLELIQREDGLAFGTDALLLAGYVNGKYKDAVELGSGSGIISMLLLAREKVQRVTCLEIQEEYAALTERNAEHNHLSDRMTAVCTDLRNYLPERECELVFTNPPYMKANSGRMCVSDKKSIARHELNGTIDEFISSGAKMLKYGGTFAIVYRPDRLCDLLTAMRNHGIEPKRITAVHADEQSEPSMILCEGKRGGKCGMKLTRPFVIYNDKSHREYTKDMEWVMDTGSFPEGFWR